MEKKEILEKAKKENKFGDERYKQVYLHGAQLGMSLGILICGIVILIDLSLHSKTTWTSLVAILIELTMQGTLYTVLAIQCKKRRDIITACFFCILFIIFVAFLLIYIITGKVL